MITSTFYKLVNIVIDILRLFHVFFFAVFNIMIIAYNLLLNIFLFFLKKKPVFFYILKLLFFYITTTLKFSVFSFNPSIYKTVSLWFILACLNGFFFSSIIMFLEKKAENFNFFTDSTPSVRSINWSKASC